MSEISVRNDTGARLDEVLLTVGDRPRQQLALGPVPDGSVSGWHSVPAAVRYPAIEASAPSADLVHLPYEGDAQPALPEGRYTYVLRIDDGRLVVDVETTAG